MCSSNKGYKTTNLYNGIMVELKKMRKTVINERICVEIGICVWEGKVMATGSKRGSSQFCLEIHKRVLHQTVDLISLADTEVGQARGFLPNS